MGRRGTIRLMDSATRPILFYLVKENEDIKIFAMTDTEMLELYKQGVRWIDCPT
jgi:hypothetical protein